MKWQIYRLKVTPQQSGGRLDQFLAQAIFDMSRTRARKIIGLGGVHINGQRTRTCSCQVKVADLVELYIDHLPLDPYRIAPADVVYHDKHLIVLNKPAAIDTQPTHARYKGTLYEALQVFLQDEFKPQARPELGMVQRLDRETTGLIVFSIHPAAHKQMTHIFHERQAQKHYLALVTGEPAKTSGKIRSCLARSRQGNRVHSVDAGGKLAETRYRVVRKLKGAALVSVQIYTGRSHQIRAHMAEMGHPLLGDGRYGGAELLAGISFGRPLLHARKLQFAHPVTGKTLRLTQPLPQETCRTIKILGSCSAP